MKQRGIRGRTAQPGRMADDLDVDALLDDLDGLCTDKPTTSPPRLIREPTRPCVTPSSPLSPNGRPCASHGRPRSTLLRFYPFLLARSVGRPLNSRHCNALLSPTNHM